jgi:hypothetical protein
VGECGSGSNNLESLSGIETINLTKNQLEKIIEVLEEKPEQVEDKYSLLSYLKLVKVNREAEQQPELDDIPF